MGVWNQNVDEVIEGPVTIETNDDGSGRTVRTFFARTKAQLQAQQAVLGSQYSFNYEDGPPFTLLATLAYSIDSPTPTPVAQWTFTRNHGSQHIFDANIDLVKNLDTDTRERIRARVKNPLKQIPLVAVGSESQLANAKETFFWMSSNVDSRLKNTITVSRTVTVPKSYLNDWSRDNEGKLLSWGTLSSTTGCPSHIASRLPAGGYEDITVTTVGLGSTETSVYKAFNGYLDCGEDRSDTSDNQVQLSNTYIYDRYPAKWYQIL